MTFILVVHHDADLYGADQSLLRTVRAIRAQGWHPIVVVPHQGPLIPLLESANAEVHVGPVVKLTRQLMRPAALPHLVRDLVQSARFMSRITAGRKVSLAYTNSVAALGGAIWARLHRIPRLWHVREIVVSPKIAAWGFPAMLSLVGGWCVCNSNASRKWICDKRPGLAHRSSVIWNGLEPMPQPKAAEVKAFREKLGFEPHHVVATLVGRINRWKGQGVLIDAAALLAKQQPNLRVLIVGDVADDQHHFREAMLQKIQSAGLQGYVQWHPFTPDISTVWAASQIAVVPSVDPEPFGRVAIEAMSHGLPVVASAHGGLAEIVQDGQTGFLVAPSDAAALAQALGKLADDAPLRGQMGGAGRLRQEQVFSQQEHDLKLMNLLGKLAGASMPVSELPQT